MTHFRALKMLFLLYLVVIGLRPASKPVFKRHHMVSGTLAPLYTVFWLELGCSRAAALIGEEVL